MSPKLETIITMLVTVGAICLVGAGKTQGWFDADTAILATGVITGGGLGWAGKTVTSASATQ